MEPPAPAHRRSRALVLAVILGLGGCGGTDDGGGAASSPSPCLTPVAAPEATRLPQHLPLEEWGTVTEVISRGGFLGAEAISTTQIVELYPEIVRTLTQGGYELLGGDNEGFEAEMTFSNPKDRLTTLTLQQGPCDEVIVRVLIKVGEGGGGST